jgi:hypothetical protein
MAGVFITCPDRAAQHFFTVHFLLMRAAVGLQVSTSLPRAT